MVCARIKELGSHYSQSTISIMRKTATLNVPRTKHTHLMASSSAALQHQMLSWSTILAINVTTNRIVTKLTLLFNFFGLPYNHLRWWHICFPSLWQHSFHQRTLPSWYSNQRTELKQWCHPLVEHSHGHSNGSNYFPTSQEGVVDLTKNYFWCSVHIISPNSILYLTTTSQNRKRLVLNLNDTQ